MANDKTLQVQRRKFITQDTGTGRTISRSGKAKIILTMNNKVGRIIVLSAKSHNIATVITMVLSWRGKDIQISESGEMQK